MAHAVVAEQAPPIAAKGKSEALVAYRLVGLRPDVPAFARPISTPFVGRRRARRPPSRIRRRGPRARLRPHDVVVSTPGIGTRLARGSSPGWSPARACSSADASRTGRGSRTFRSPTSCARSRRGAEAELARILASADRGDVAARLIAGATGGRDGLGSPEETAWAFRTLFETLAASRPLVVVVDDIHWAEPVLLDLLEYLVGFSSGAPILVVCPRPDLLDVRATWAAPRRRATLVSWTRSAGGVGCSSTASCATARSRRACASGSWTRPKGTHSSSSRSRDARGRSRHRRGIDPADDPRAARRPHRPPRGGGAAVLQHAAVEGRLFHRGAVGALLRDGAGLGGTLLGLARKEFVRPDRALLPGDDGFRFNHVLIRDVAGTHRCRGLRAELHARLATWLEQSATAG